MLNVKKYIGWIMLFTYLVLGSTSASAQSKLWATAYYAGWMQGQNNDGHLPAQQIDFSAVTHIVHFALVPKSDGTLDYTANSITPTNSAELISAAHAKGVKVIISIGGWNSGDGFASSVSPVYLTTFVNNLVSFITSRGYDGIDIDWEPLRASDAALYIPFITALRSALDLAKPGALLTAANGSEADIFAQVHPLFDQINLMTYDMAGPWPGWVTWHNSPVSDGGYVFPSTGGAVPSTDRAVDNFIAAGIPANKIGIGIDFYGYVWNGGSGTSTGGVTKPRQTWTSDPWVQGNVPYYTIMQNYYQPQYYAWDDAAKAAYLSIDNTGSVNDKFISYDDEKTVQAKFDYARTKGIGGLIVWELGGGYRADQPAGQKDVLLQAVKKALNGGTTADVTLPIVSITSPVNGATLSGTVTINSNASDNVGVAGVQFKVDGTNSGNEITTAPYTTSLNTTTLSNGTHTISAVARDAAGNTATASVSVAINNPTLDTTPPVVSITSPSNNSTVTATISISSTATDNVGVAGVQFKLDGSLLGSEVATSPYNFSFNTTQTSNGTHTLSAVARDAAGNTSTASVTINVSNSTGSTTTKLAVYNDDLQSPWINSSWSSSVNFGSTEKYYTGAKSIKTALTSSWGALSLHYGNWGSQGLNASQYQKFEFAVYAPTSGTKLLIFFQNDQGQSFPQISYKTIAANQWTVISIPMSQLNPNNQYIGRITIQETSGARDKVFFVDDINFTGSETQTVPSAPLLASPSNSSTGVSTNPTLSWNITSSAVSYRLQVSTSSAFTTNVIDQSGITSTSFNGNGLANSTTYYWRVNASNNYGTSNWSSVFSFTTSAQTVTAKLAVYEESLLSPWINASWGTTLNFSNTQKVFEGSYAISFVQGGWAALRLRSGSWGSPVNVNTNSYANFDFAVFGGSNGITLRVYFENDLNQSFPNVDNIQVAANQWKTVSIPVTQLNPNNRVVHNIVIQNFSGEQKTYYIDNIRFTGSSSSQKLAEETTTEDVMPEEFALSQNYPNPFNPSTTISFTIPKQSYVTLKIYNILGEEVKTLISNTLPAGSYNEIWDASNFPSGIYIYQLSSDNNVLVKKMNLVK